MILDCFFKTWWTEGLVLALPESDVEDPTANYMLDMFRQCNEYELNNFFTVRLLH